VENQAGTGKITRQRLGARKSFFSCHLCFFCYNATTKYPFGGYGLPILGKKPLMVNAALEKKASEWSSEMRAITNLRTISLICSGKSERQVQAIAQSIADVLEKEGSSPWGWKETREGRWVFAGLWEVVAMSFLTLSDVPMTSKAVDGRPQESDFKKEVTLARGKPASKKKTGQSETDKPKAKKIKARKIKGQRTEAG